jgi:hypothetical protein
MSTSTHLSAEDLDTMSEAALSCFCKISTLPRIETDDPDNDCETLSLMHGGWCGPVRDGGVSTSCARSVKTVLEMRPAVLHADEIINKKDQTQVRYLLTELLRQKVPVQVAFLQGAVPLQNEALFPRLLQLLTTCPVWSINLGEIRFSEEQCAKLAEALRQSGVTHMFYECTVAGQWKEEFRAIIRANRAKHGLWRLGPDAEQNRVILSAVKSWYVPMSHSTNKRWIHRFHNGWSDVQRVQCEACGKWRRLPASLDGWPQLFYCALNTWEPRLASCEAMEEEWASGLPMNGDIVVCLLHAGVWLEGTVQSMPRGGGWLSLPRVGLPPPASRDDVDAPPRERVDLAVAPILFGGRQRKRPELYDASTSSTEYTKQLRKREEEEEAQRRSSLIIDFADGVTRCVKIVLGNRGSEWVFDREWPAKCAELRQSIPPPPQLSAGDTILYRVDGKAWRRISLVRQGVTDRQWAHIYKYGLGPAAEMRSAHANGSAPYAPAGRPSGPGGDGQCRPGARGGGGGGGGGGGDQCEGDDFRRQHALPATAAVPATTPAVPSDPAARALWWHARYKRVQLLVCLCESTRLQLWHAPEHAMAVGGLLAASLPDDDEEEADEGGSNGSHAPSGSNGSHAPSALVHVASEEPAASEGGDASPSLGRKRGRSSAGAAGGDEQVGQVGRVVMRVSGPRER